MSNELTPDLVIKHLKLKPLEPEGGYFRETMRSNTQVSVVYGNEYQTYSRIAGTAIYFLITSDNFSRLHRVRHDEVFHFYLGTSVDLVWIDDEGEKFHKRLGSNILAGEELQVTVPANSWQGLKMHGAGAWALLGTTVTPGFEWEDFEIGHREQLISEFPKHSELIASFT